MPGLASRQEFGKLKRVEGPNGTLRGGGPWQTKGRGGPTLMSQELFRMTISLESCDVPCNNTQTAAAERRP